jgi:hypothetical protein
LGTSTPRCRSWFRRSQQHDHLIFPAGSKKLGIDVVQPIRAAEDALQI